MSPSLKESETSDEVVAQETEAPLSDYSLPESWRSLEDDTAQPVAAAKAKTGGAGTVVRAVLYIVAALAIGGAAFAAGRYTAVSAVVVAPSPSPVTITISSTSPGDAVVVDGREVGVTPYQLTVENGVRDVRLASPPLPPSLPQPVATSLSATAAADTLTPSRPRSGGLRVSSAIEVQVLEGERVIGSSVDGPIVASAGVHQLDFVNSAFGYRERRAFEFKAGQILALTVTPPNGRLNVNAVPWAQVTIDGKEVGETPLANLSIPVGQHEIVFRHPQLGEKRETAIVRSGSMTRLSVTMAR